MISHRHNVLFVHIPKCAGQAIESAFLRDLGLDWGQRQSLLLRKRAANEFGPDRLAHLYAHEYVKFGYLTEVDFSKMYKFTIVRDPIDRILSELNYKKINRGYFGVNSVEEYIVKTRRKFGKYSDTLRHLEPQVNYLYDEKFEKIIVDKIIQLSDLEEQFKKVKTAIGFSSLDLKRENISHSRKWRRSELSNDDINYIKDTYALDYNLLFDAEI